MRKGKRDYHSSFVRIGRDLIFRSEEWKRLSLRAKILYVTLKAKYNGSNNGEIQLHFSEMATQPGFSSRRGFYGAVQELVAAGWIEKNNAGPGQQVGGGLFRNPNLYVLTGKYDALL